MAQFDIHANRGRLQSEAPFLVVVQSSRFDNTSTRLVIPLIVRRTGSASELTPALRIGGQTLYLNALQMFAMPVRLLGPVVASLADDASAARIIAAIDEVITTVHG
jgi:toxin CcdB